MIENKGSQNRYFCDLHVHVGRAGNNQPVKITASKDLTLQAILEEAAHRKGIDIIGVIDGSSPAVQEDLQVLLQQGDLYELAGGGLRYKDRTTLFLGAEVETAGPAGGAAHFGIWMPSLPVMKEFSRFLKTQVSNVLLSSQRARCQAYELQQMAQELGGWFIVNHAFTPHKGMYGNCVTAMAEMVDPALVTAIELGLSADTQMADRIQELHELPFVSNSDAHSTAKIAREYNVVELQEPTFDDLTKALQNQEGRKIIANYGLHPLLGKYHRTSCYACGFIPSEFRSAAIACDKCGSANMIQGVADRLEMIADLSQSRSPEFRPPYFYQIPLEYIPKVGKKTLEKLLDAFGTEMSVIHQASFEELAAVIGTQVAQRIVDARMGQVDIQTGGAGVYGKVL
ncbi:endonuclease Q family protein [Fodinisporobacter ferrooxydans]|uniref:Endonuclease Q family protein n=1 Tax=Fodinisporobacter ferrooxydans TaxID=2901836 RepID=A0ABY4CKD7_9BACL|nr:endonuclease Q family protein [Alicyclobacillaceae bacterium MYW30-H2]